MTGHVFNAGHFLKNRAALSMTAIFRHFSRVVVSVDDEPHCFLNAVSMRREHFPELLCFALTDC